MSWFANPWGLLALLSLPAVVVLHLYRRRHQELPVSTLFLWSDAESEDSAGRQRHPLRRTPSFWLELAAALLASLAVAGFDPWRGGSAEHLVAVLDDGAAMGARGGGPSPRDAAVDELLERLDDLGRRTRVSLVASGARPRLLVGPAALAAEARAALADWTPRQPTHTLTPALALARELAGDGRVLLLSDRPHDDLALDDATELLALGRPRPNLALLDPERTPVDADTDRLRCRVRSFADGPRRAELVLTASGQELTRRAVGLDADDATAFELELPAATPAVTLTLEHDGDDDGLALDDRVVLHPVPRRPVRVGWSLDEGLAERLGLDELTRVFEGLLPAADEADLVFAHEPVPAPAWSVLLPHDGDGAEAFLGPFLIQRDHPLLTGVTLDGVLWTRAEGEGPTGLPLVSAGDRPLVTQVVTDDAVQLRLDLLPSRSTLQRSPDWPILLANLIAERRAALPGVASVLLMAGEPLLASATTPVDWVLTGPDGERRVEGQQRLVLDDLPPHGDYRLRSSDGSVTAGFAVQLADAAVSDLRAAGPGRRAPADGDAGLASGAHGGSTTELLLLILLAGLVAADWWVLGGGRS